MTVLLEHLVQNVHSYHNLQDLTAEEECPLGIDSWYEILNQFQFSMPTRYPFVSNVVSFACFKDDLSGESYDEPYHFATAFRGEGYDPPSGSSWNKCL